jgi:hypothetical protein
MNKLALTKRLSRDCGINQVGPASTTNQTGEYLRLVNWIDDAYKSIQIIHRTWQFLRKEFSFPMVVGTPTYTPTVAGLTDFAGWVADSDGDSEDFRIYLTASDEQYMVYMPWDDFRQTYYMGSQRTQTGRPHVYTIKPDDTLMFFPIPDQIYTCLGEYYMTPDEMTLDTDVPIFPVRFHEIVLYRAMMFYGAYSQEPDKYSVGAAEYKKILRGLELSQLPQMEWGEPLA